MDLDQTHYSTNARTDSELRRVFKCIRICAIIIASSEMMLGAISIASNLGIFTYYLIEASKGNLLKKPDFFFEKIIDLDLEISAKTLSKITAFMFVYSVVHFVASIFLFQGAKSLSHEKCRWSFILYICLWTVGIIVIVAPLNDKILMCVFITVFSLKVVELAVIKRLMDELYYFGFDR